MMKKNVLALVLAICLLLSTLPIQVFAESDVPISEPVEAWVEEATGETDAPGLTADGGEAATEDDSFELAYADEPEATAFEPAEYAEGTAAAMPGFITGYVRIIVDGAALLNDDAVTIAFLPENAVAYAYDRNLEDRLALCMDTAGGVVTGWVDAGALKPLDAAETDAFVQAVDGSENVRFFDAECTIPLGVVEAQWAEGFEPAAASETAITDALDELQAEEAQSDLQDEAQSDAQDEAQPDAQDDPEAPEALPEIAAAPDAAMALDRAELTLGVGQTGALAIARIAEDAGAVVWTSSDDAVASVSDSGEITGVGIGEAVITADAENGDSASCVVTVLAMPETLSFNVEKLSIGLGETSYALKAIQGPGEGPFAGKLQYTTSNKKYVTVDENGALKGVKRGSATVKVTSENGLTASCKVTVTKAPAGVTVSPAKLSLSVGQTGAVKATPTKGTASTTYYYETSDASVATVENGIVTALSAGEATITVRAYKGKSAACKVTVYNQPTSVVLEADALTVPAEQKKTLGVRALDDAGAQVPATFTFEIDPQSPNPDCVTVNPETGEIAALNRGEAIIVATTHNDVSAACRITVVPAPMDFRFGDASAVTLGVGEKYDGLRLELIPPEGEDVCDAIVTWRSSKSSVAKVSADGVVTAMKAGSAVIYAKTHNGIEHGVSFTVKKAPGKVTVSPASLKLSVGMRGAIKVSTDRGALTNPFRYTSDNEAVAIVENGEVVALSEGSAVITVKSYNGKTATCKVTVLGAPESLALGEYALKVPVGQKKRLTTKAFDAAGGEVPANLTFEVSDASENPGCIALDAASGDITGTAKGRATVVVTTHNGVEAACAVEVVPAPAAIAFADCKSITLGVGETDNSLADCLVLTPPEGESACEAVITWKSSSVKIAKVDAATGAVKALKAGRATVTATTHNGLSATMEVVVKVAPKSVTASPSKLTLGLGESAQMAYKLPAGASGAAVWTSANADIVSVTPEGLVQANSRGTAKLTVTTYNNKKATATVEVLDAPDSVAMEADTVTLGVGQSAKLSAILPEGSAGAVSFASMDEGVATVSGNTITGASVGECVIVAETYNHHTATCRAVVKPAPTTLTLPYENNTLYLGLGDKVQLKPDVGEAASSFTYAASSAKIASVNASGVVTGKKTGTAYVTVKTYNGLSLKLKVVVRKAPDKVTAAVKQYMLGVGETFTLGYKLPSSTSATVYYTSTDDSVASVDAETGLVTAHAPGQASIVVHTFNNKTDSCIVTVCDAPDALYLDADSVELGAGQTHAIAAALPEGTWSNLTYTSADSAVATVSADGTIMAIARGETVVRVETHVPGVWAEVRVKVWNAPDSLTLDAYALTINVEETYVLDPQIPEDSRTSFTYKSSNSSIAAVDERGVITAIQRGSVTITVSTHNGLTAQLALTVYDPWYPEAIFLNEPVPMLMIGDTWQATYTVVPETARPGLVWTSSNTKVAEVDQNGFIIAKNLGYAVITAQSQRNSACKVSFTVVVQSEDYTLVIPARTTGTSGISENRAKINAIKDCSIGEIQRLYENGLITKSDADKRKSIVNNVFKNYDFPWMTPKKQSYWKAANSEGGVKDFKPDRVYYGMPYISGSGTNRAYNAEKALNEKRYTSSGKGYYLLNQNNYVSGKYVGNDCSGLCNVSIWGTSSSHTYDRTKDIAKISAYVTKSYAALRPGDLICKSSAHVVMFLYWADVDHTKMMMIENGGAEAGTNTVHCDVHDVSYYKNKGYSVRRLSTLG